RVSNFACRSWHPRDGHSDRRAEAKHTHSRSRLGYHAESFQTIHLAALEVRRGPSGTRPPGLDGRAHLAAVIDCRDHESWATRALCERLLERNGSDVSARSSVFHT